MSILRAGIDQIALSTRVTVRELALSADLAAWAGERDRCVAMIARIYDVFDDLQVGRAPDLRSRVMSADAAVWVGDRVRQSAIIGGLLESFGAVAPGHHGKEDTRRRGQSDDPSADL